jgi:CheY-like chemotaxis protein
MFSIDQNCHSLWDVITKIHALCAAGHRVTHFIEDIDTAFTALGSQVDDDQMQLAAERFHRSGGQDWGAALFYSCFLGKLPVEIRQFEPFTGLKTSKLAKHLDCSVDELYDRYSPGDNWQLIGSSYIGDRRHHRVIGDLTVEQTRPFLHELMGIARTDLFQRFPEPQARKRIESWFDREQAKLETLLERNASGRLVDLYHHWMRTYLDKTPTRIRLTSDLLRPDGPILSARLLHWFCQHYDQLAALYNEALEETDSPLRPLKAKDGELPFFAALTHQGHQVRCHVNYLDGKLVIADRQIPIGSDGQELADQLRQAEIHAVAGKALVLVLQVRMGPEGDSLALPYRGSLYMPAAHRLGFKLREAGLWEAPLAPLVRVRLGLLDRMAGTQTLIRLPDHLAEAMGREEIPADKLARRWPELGQDARRRLEKFRSDRGREAWQKHHCRDLLERIDKLDGQRREIARENPKDPRMREIWIESRTLQEQVLQRTLDQIARDWQVADVDYWDSRGALLPWSIALGGESFYDSLIQDAKVYTETPPSPAP